MVRVELPQRSAMRPGLIAAPAGRYTVFVVDWGHHTSIIVPQPVAWGIGPDADPGAPFVEYAWGDRRYYAASHPSVLSGLRALFLTGPSTTYVQAWRAPPRPSAALDVRIEQRDVSSAELLALVSALESSIDRAKRFPAVPGYAGQFYGGVRRYSWWYDCNRWIVARLASARLAHGGRGIVFAGQVPHWLSDFTPVVVHATETLLARPGAAR